MRTTGYLLAFGFLSGLFALSGACSDETGTSSGGTTQSTTSSSGNGSSSGNTSTSSSSGNTSTSSSSGNTSTSSSSSGNTSTSSSGGQSCGDCTSAAPGGACKTQFDACMANADCVKVYNCAYTNPNCTTTPEGACCTRKCITDSAVPMAASDLYLAYDKCVYCTTCKGACTDGTLDAAGYCTNLDAANPVCP